MAAGRNSISVIGPEVTVNPPISPSVNPNAPKHHFPAAGAQIPSASPEQPKDAKMANHSVVLKAVFGPTSISTVEDNISPPFPSLERRSPTLETVYSSNSA